MRWKKGRQSSNLEDRRGQRIRRGRGVKGGIGAIVIALAASYFLGIDPSLLLNSGLIGGDAPQSTRMVRPDDPQQEELKQLASAVLASTEDTWGEIFRQNGSRYREPKMVLFTGVVDSACGRAGSAMGPFYCPGDQKIYLDLAFYDELKRKMGAPGDFAQAYVIAHEVGHHVQKLLGVSDRVHNARNRLNEKENNALSVRLELQADCFAGIWAHNADTRQQWLEKGDLEEALNAASQIGDDTLQKRARGYAVPDSFTHGTSAQRMSWFRRGFESGDPNQCDTFRQ